MKIWVLEYQNTSVRLLGAGVSGLEEPDARSIEYDTTTQNALDKTLDEIKRRYNDNKAAHALALRTDKKRL